MSLVKTLTPLFMRIKGIFKSAMTHADIQVDEVMLYDEYRDNIETGDLAFFTRTNNRNIIGRIWSVIIRTLTRHEICHSGILVDVGKRVLLVEAVIPMVRIIPATRRLPMYVVQIPHQTDRRDEYLDEALGYAGTFYSIPDAVWAYILPRTNRLNKGVQCQELQNDFVESMALIENLPDVPGEAYDWYGDRYKVIKLVESMEDES